MNNPDNINALQAPVPSAFDAASTAAEVLAGIDLRGKVAIVTGGHSSIGLETVRALCAAGAKVIVPARDVDKAAAALTDLPGVEIRRMDLISPATIDAFAGWFLSTGRPLHILINNAGIMATPLMRDERGYEAQFATNHLGHFQLTVRLWPALLAAGEARVVSVSSWGHRRSPVVYDDPNFERRNYDPFLAYGQSKTANALFAVGLDRRGREHGIRAFSLHPGGVLSASVAGSFTKKQLQAGGLIDEAGNPIIDPARSLKTVEQGAATSVWCAINPALNGMGGAYCQDCNIAPLVPSDAVFGAVPLGVMAYAVDEAAAEQLWQLSENLCRCRV